MGDGAKDMTWNAIKGIACMFIVAGHFYYGFYAHISGNYEVYGIVKGFHRFFSFCMNGTFMVSVFCVLSGLFINQRINRFKEVVYYIIRRYFRFLISLLFYCILIGLIGYFTMYSSAAKMAETLSNPWLVNVIGRGGFSIGDCLSACIYKIIFLGDTRFSGVLWVIRPMFFGYCVSIGWIYVDNYCRKIRGGGIVSLIVCILLICICIQFNYCSAGVLMGCIWKRYLIKRMYFPHRMAPLMLIIALLIGHFGLYNVGINKVNDFFQIILAVVFLTCVNNSPFIKIILNKKSFQILGDISFSVYLLHMVIVTTFSCRIIDILMSLGKSEYNFIYLVAAISTYLLVIVVSLLWNRTIEKVDNRLYNRMQSMLKKMMNIE